LETADFVALDPLQQRIRRDMAIDGKQYIYRAGDSPTGDEDASCTFNDAATALACAAKDISLVAKAKRVVSELWANTKEPPYTTLFPSNIDADTVWRAVRIQKAILSKISEVRDSSSGRSKTILSQILN
jgi:hypothetical protein